MPGMYRKRALRWWGEKAVRNANGGKENRRVCRDVREPSSQAPLMALKTFLKEKVL